MIRIVELIRIAMARLLRKQQQQDIAPWQSWPMFNSEDFIGPVGPDPEDPSDLRNYDRGI